MKVQGLILMCMVGCSGATAPSIAPPVTPDLSAEASCVDPNVDARRALDVELASLAAGDPRFETIESGTLPDLDADGTPEQVRLLNVSGSSFSSTHLLYLSASGCAQFAGALFASPEIGTYVEVLDVAVDGHKSLRAYNKMGCAGLEGTLTTYTWSTSHGRYTPEANVECTCPETNSSERAEGCP